MTRAGQRGCRAGTARRTAPNSGRAASAPAKAFKRATIGRARAARPEDVGHCFRRATCFESSRYTRAKSSKTLPWDGGTRAPRARNDGRGASKTPARAEAAGKGFRKGVQSESSSRAAGCQRAVRERKHSKPGGIFDCNGYIKAERGRATGGPIFYCAQLCHLLQDPKDIKRPPVHY